MAGLGKKIWIQADEIKSAEKEFRGLRYHNKRMRIESSYRNFGNVRSRIERMKRKLENMQARLLEGNTL
ncbi:MAG: hypothetical protein LBL46_04665 [Rickettsiales bacterium]|nr:hypothetical protein [Rickettsiales bacterium]